MTLVSALTSNVLLDARVARLVGVSRNYAVADAMEELNYRSFDEGARRNWEAQIVSSLTMPVAEDEQIDVVDLFSGCGGLSLGFELAGFNVVAGIDSWEYAVESYSKNFNHDCYRQDLSEMASTVELIKSKLRREKRFGIIGGPPCQDFSLAGKREEKSRAEMTMQFARFVQIFQPEFFLMENVPNALKSGIYREALEELEKDYAVITEVLEAFDHGVPQRRKRLFAFGCKDAEISNRVRQNLKYGLELQTFTLEEWFGSNGIDSAYYRHPRSYQRRGIFSAKEPSPTIRGVNRPVPPTYKKHHGDVADPKMVRALSSEQRAQIQTFPSGFCFTGPQSAIEQMVGNAVPVRLANFVAKAILDEIA